MPECNTEYVVVQARYLFRSFSYWSGPELALKNVIVARSDQSMSNEDFRRLRLCQMAGCGDRLLSSRILHFIFE